MRIEAFAMWSNGGQAKLAIAGSNLTGVDRAACTAMCCMRPLCRLAAPLVFPKLLVEVARDGVLHTWRSLSGTLDGFVGSC